MPLCPNAGRIGKSDRAGGESGVEFEVVGYDRM